MKPLRMLPVHHCCHFVSFAFFPSRICDMMLTLMFKQYRKGIRSQLRDNRKGSLLVDNQCHRGYKWLTGHGHWGTFWNNIVMYLDWSNHYMGIYSVQTHLTLHLKSLNLSQGNSISNYKNSDNQMNTRIIIQFLQWFWLLACSELFLEKK